MAAVCAVCGGRRPATPRRGLGKPVLFRPVYQCVGLMCRRVPAVVLCLCEEYVCVRQCGYLFVFFSLFFLVCLVS